MRTGAIFARGSCRALKWMALVGVVFVLGAASAVAQPGDVTDARVTINVGESVDTGRSATVTVTVTGELGPGTATSTATTVTVTVSAAGLAGDSTATDYEAQQTALAALNTKSPVNAVTPAEDGDYTILDVSSNTDETTGLVTIVLGPNTNTTRSIDVSGEGTFQLLGRDADRDAEDEALRLTATALTATGRNAADDADEAATVTLQTGFELSTVFGDMKVNDPQDQEYVLALDPATQDPMEGASITASLKAMPTHVQGSKTLTLNLDKPAPDYDFTFTTAATGAVGSGGDSITLGDLNAATDGGTTPATAAENMAEITITTTDNDENRTDDTLTLSAYSGQVGSGVLEDDLALLLKDLHMLPMVKGILVDAQGTALNPQPSSVTEGMNYMLKLTVVDDEGMALESRFAEELTVRLTQTADADPQDDYSLGSSTITIPSGEMESGSVTLEVDLDDDLGDESLVFSAVVNGEDTDYGAPQPDLNPMDALSLTITDATMPHVWVADGAVAAIEAAMMTAQGDDGKLNVNETISIQRSALFESAAGYSVRLDIESSDLTVAGADDVTDWTDFRGDVLQIWPRAPGTATITITGTAVAPSGVVTPVRQTQVDVAQITVEVMVELAVPGMPQILPADERDGHVVLSWNAPARGGEVASYEYDQDASDEWTSTGTARTATVTGLTNGEKYIFRVRARNASGVGEAARVEATPVATPVDASQVVTVKSVSAATSVDESGGLEVTVTATVPAGTKGADDKIAPIASKHLYVSFPTDDASIEAGEDADAGELTALGATNGYMYTWEKITRTEKASEATYKFRVAVGQDLDAEDEKFQVEVSIDGDGKRSKVVTIDDAQEQTYVLSLPAAAKGAIAEGKSATLTLTADPAKTINIPFTLALEPNDPSKYTLNEGRGFFGVDPFETTVGTKADSDRTDDTITVTAHAERQGNLTSLDITVTDANALPAVKATLVDKDGKALDPQPESVMEGETVKVMLTAVDKDGKATKAAEKLTITLMPTGTADASDYRLSSQSIEIASGKESSGAVDLMITADQDIGDETLTFDAAVGGEAKNGTEKRSVAGVLSLMITDGTQKLVYAKTQEEVEAAIYAAKNAGAGDDMTFTAGETIDVMGSALFSSAEGVTLSYTAESSMSGVASASVSGDTVMVTAVAEGMTDITITAHASMASGVKILDQTDPGMASVMFPVEVGLEALSIMLSGPEDMNLAEGMSAMVTATANRAATADTMVMLMRDRAMSTAGDDDYTAEAITIMAGEMTGSTMVMAVEDNMAEDMEELVLYGMTEGMAGEVTGEVHLYLWDAAVPALPVIAQLLLAAFLAVGGYRRYRRR